MSNHEAAAVKADDPIPSMVSQSRALSPQLQPQTSTVSPPTHHPGTPSSPVPRSPSPALPNPRNLHESDTATRAPHFWKTFSFSNNLQSCAIILGVVVAFYTINYAVRGYNLAVWTAFKDEYEWCENEVQAFNRTAESCTKLLESPLPPPPYVDKVYKRRLKDRGRAYVHLGNIDIKSHGDWAGSITSIALVSYIAILVCISLLAGLAGLGRLQPVSFLDNRFVKKLPFSTKILTSICFLGHLAVLPCVAIHILTSMAPNWHPWWATFSYRTALAGAITGHGIIVHSSRGIRAVHVRWSVSVLNLGLALVWFFSEPHPLLVLPFSAYSIGYVVCFARVAFVPGVYAQAQHDQEGASLSSGSGSATVPCLIAFTEYWVGFARASARILEALLWAHLFHSTALDDKRSFHPVVVYTIFLGIKWARYHVEGAW